MKTLIVSSVTNSDSDRWSVRVDGRLLRCPLVASSENDLMHIKYVAEPSGPVIRRGALLEILTDNRELTLIVGFVHEAYKLTAATGPLEVVLISFDVVDDRVRND